jgi:antitoxin (DNA-binding transcriptional repressor) of toxin-antitoxin stability system
MKTATIRDLRNHFPRVASWIAEGESVEITKAGKLFARLVPPTPVKTPKLVKPDILARLKETWGDRVFSAKEVAEMRAAELDSEEG